MGIVAGALTTGCTGAEADMSTSFFGADAGLGGAGCSSSVFEAGDTEDLRLRPPLPLGPSPSLRSCSRQCRFSVSLQYER